MQNTATTRSFGDKKTTIMYRNYFTKKKPINEEPITIKIDDSFSVLAKK